MNDSRADDYWGWADNAGAWPVMVTLQPVWRARAGLPEPRRAFGGAYLDGKIYAVGGTDHRGGAHNDLFEFNRATNTWQSRAPLPSGRYDSAVAAGNGKLYVIGGGDGSREVATLLEYDPRTDHWTTKAGMPGGARFAFAAAVASNGKIYAVGGNCGGCPELTRVEEYDPSTNLTFVQLAGGATLRARVNDRVRLGS